MYVIEVPYEKQTTLNPDPLARFCRRARTIFLFRKPYRRCPPTEDVKGVG